MQYILNIFIIILNYMYVCRGFYVRVHASENQKMACNLQELELLETLVWI